VFVSRGNAQVNRREHRKHIGLDDRDKDMKPDEGHGDGNGKNRQDGTEHGEFTPGEEGQLDEQAEKDGVKQVAGQKYSPKDVL